MNAPMPEVFPDHRPANAASYEVNLLQEPLGVQQSGMDVLELLATMRNYHQLRDFSHQERFGVPDSQSRKALAKLGELQRSLQDFLAAEQGAGEDCVVEVSLNLRMTPAASTA